MPVKFPCPQCQAVMKVSRKVPLGTPVMCPACSKVFPNPGRSSRRHRHHHHSRHGRSSGKLKLMRIGMVAALVAMLGVVGVGGFYLYNVFAGGTPGRGGGLLGGEPAINKGTGKEDPLAYVPADSTILVGLNGATMAGNPALKALLEGSLGQLGLGKTAGDCKAQTGLACKDLFETALVALKMPPDGGKPESVTVVLKAGADFDQKKMGEWASTSGAQKFKDKFYYNKHKDAAQYQTVFM